MKIREYFLNIFKPIRPRTGVNKKDVFEDYQTIDLIKINMFYMNLIANFKYLLDDINNDEVKSSKLFKNLKNISSSLLKSKEHESRYAILYSKDFDFKTKSDVSEYVNYVLENYDEKHIEVINLNNEINNDFQIRKK